jgi:hypothetical protein
MASSLQARTRALDPLWAADHLEGPSKQREGTRMSRLQARDEGQPFTAVLCDANHGDALVHVTAATPEEAAEKALRSFLDGNVKPELHTTYREYHLAWIDHLFRGRLEDLSPRA